MIKAYPLLRCILGMCCALQNPLAVTFQDKEGTLFLENLDNWKTKKIDAQKFEFFGEGKPLKGVWTLQNLSLESNKIKGVLYTKNTKNLKLDRAALEGNVKIIIVSKINQNKDTAKLNNFGTLILKCPALDLSEQLTKAKIPGPFAMENTMEEPTRRMELHGSRGDFLLFPLTKNKSEILKEGTVYGPVTLKYQGHAYKQTQGNSKIQTSSSKETELEPLTINAKANMLYLNTIQRKIILSGNVHIQGTDNMMAGTAEAAKVTFIFDEQHQLSEVNFEGHPGQSTLTNKRTREIAH